MKYITQGACILLFLLFASVHVKAQDDDSVCEVHHIRMELKSVPINYGLVRYPPSYIDAKAAHFPHGWEYVNGGCIVQKQTEKQIYVCEQCKKAEAAFARKFEDGKSAGKEQVDSH